jgi:hypothetical protein
MSIDMKLEDIMFSMDNEDEIIIPDDPVEEPEEGDTEEPEDTTEDPEEGPDEIVVEPEDEEPEEPEEEPEEPEEEPVETEEEPEEVNQIQAYFDVLKETGYLNLDDDFEFDGTEEGLEAALEESQNITKQTALADWYNSLSPDFQEVVKYASEGGTSMKDFVNSYKNIADYSDYDTSVEDDQVKLIADYYKLNTEFSDTKIQRLINNMSETGDLEEEAIDAQEYLLNYEENRKADLAKEQELRNQAIADQAAEERRLIDEAIQTSSVVQGRRKNSIKAFMFNPIKRGQEVDTDFNRTLKDIASNAEHRVILADLLYDYDPKKGFSFSRYESKGKKKATRNIKKALDSKLGGFALKGKKTPAPAKVKATDWEQILQNLE